MASILLISPDGMLGRAFVEIFETKKVAFDGATYPAFDITSDSSVAEHVREEHRLVINCSAYTDVDGAETHEAACRAVNGTGVGRLAARCRSVGATLVHFSTDYVFDGAAASPYRTDHPYGALGVYGRTKAEGEQAIRASGVDHLIVRTSWLYAPWAKNFVLTMADLCRSRDSLRVVDDQRGRPTSAQHLAATTLALVERGARDIAHVTDGGECSWFELARHVVSRVRPECRVDPCTTAEFPRPAKRPAYSVLDLSETEGRLGPMPPWQDQVDAVLERAGIVPRTP